MSTKEQIKAGLMCPKSEATMAYIKEHDPPLYALILKEGRSTDGGRS